MAIDRWEAKIFNQYVRESFDKEGYNSTSFGDKWADPHYIIVFAQNRFEAEKLFKHQYPEEKGFVVTDIVNLDRSE